MKTVLFLLLLLVPLDTVQVAEAAPTGPGPVVVPTLHKCPGNYICFYQNKNFGGRMIKSKTVGWNDMWRMKFQDETSSWVDNAPYFCGVEVTGKSKYHILWFEGGVEQRPFVGKSVNDQAWWFDISGVCH